MKGLLFSLLALTLGPAASGQDLRQLYQAHDYAALVQQAPKAKAMSAEDLYWLGRAYFQLGDDAHAIGSFDQSLTKGGPNSGVYYHRALALRYAKRYPEALSSFDAALKLEPQNPNFQTEKALVYYHTERYDEALHLFESLAKLAEAPPAAVYMVPHIHHLQQQFQQALPEYYQALARLPQDNEYYADALTSIGKLEYTLTRNFDKSAAAYGRAIRLQPKEYELYAKLMKSYNEAGRLAQADSVFRVFQGFYQQQQLPEEYTRFGTVAVDDYQYNGRQLTMYRSLKDPAESLDIAYKVYLLEPGGAKIERIFLVEQTMPLPDGPKYLLCEKGVKTSGHRTFPYGWKEGALTVPELKKAVGLVLDGKLGASASSSFK